MLFPILLTLEDGAEVNIHVECSAEYSHSDSTRHSFTLDDVNDLFWGVAYNFPLPTGLAVVADVEEQIAEQLAAMRKEATY